MSETSAPLSAYANAASPSLKVQNSHQLQFKFLLHGDNLPLDPYIPLGTGPLGEQDLKSSQN